MFLLSFLEDNELTVVLPSKIDQHDAKKCIAMIESKLENYTPSVCVLDCHEITFLDDSSVDVIRNALHATEKRNCKLMVSRLQDQPMIVFMESDVSKLVEIKKK